MKKTIIETSHSKRRPPMQVTVVKLLSHYDLLHRFSKAMEKKTYPYVKFFDNGGTWHTHTIDVHPERSHAIRVACFPPGDARDLDPMISFLPYTWKPFEIDRRGFPHRFYQCADPGYYLPSVTELANVFAKCMRYQMVGPTIEVTFKELAN